MTIALYAITRKCVKYEAAVTFIDSKVKKERQLEWIDCIEEFDALLNP